MMEIEFRGKRKDTGEWLQGYFYEECGNTYIIENRQKKSMANCNHPYLVDPETVAQYTGLEDENGVKIFEDDIVNAVYEDSRSAFYRQKCIGVVMFLDYGWSVDFEQTTGLYSFERFVDDFSKIKVIGNIHDNPELLEA